MNPNFLLVLTLCTIPAFTSSKYLLVQVAENGGRESRSNPAYNEKSLTLNIDQEPMNIESRVQENGLIHKIQLGTLCSTKSFNEIESADKCKAAATKLGLKWGGTWSGKGDFPACFHAEDGRNTVFFNTNQNPGRTNLNQRYAAICKEKDQANINYDIELGGKTKLVGNFISGTRNASVAFPMGDNIFIVACVDGWTLKMVKIRVTGETTFDWMESKYYEMDKLPAKCKTPETFTAECFVGVSAKQWHYNVELVAKQVGKWSDWSECSESCGSGFQVKTRKVFCKVKKNCKDEEKETRQCQIRNNQCEDV